MLTRNSVWKAPKPDVRTAHDVRKLRTCEVCGVPGTSLMQLSSPPKRGKPARYAHGYCYARNSGVDALAALPYDELMKISLDEMIALGFRGNAGYLRFEKMCEAAAKRGASS